MLNLINLEFRKNNLSTYYFAALCIFIMGFGFCFLFAFAPQIEMASGNLPSYADLEIFTQWSNFTMLIATLFTMSFVVLSAVMHTKFTIEEYTGKRAVLLFSYPQSRSKILFAKTSLVFVFTAVGLILCNTFAVLIFSVISNTFGILPNPFEVSMLPDLLSISGVCGLLAASAGLIAMRVGFWKKSLAATIVTAVILIAPLGNILSFFPQQSKTIQFVAMTAMLFIGLLIFMGLLAKVNQMEAL